MNDADDSLLQQLHELIVAQLTGELTPEQHAHLEELLQTGDPFRRAYLEHMHDAAVLHHVLHGGGDGDGEDDFCGPAEQPGPPRNNSCGQPTRQSKFARLSAFMAHPTPFSVAVAALTIGLLITAMAFMLPPFYRQLSDADGEPGNLSPSVFVAQLSGTHKAVWAEGQIGTRDGAHLVAGHGMELISGLVEIEFLDGARVVLEGPATWTVDTRSQVSLERGRLTARVESPAAGFSVVTSVATFVDLGTEFGVEVRKENAAEAHVFEGVVEARIANSAGGGATVHQITQGGGLRIDGATGIPEGINASKSSFVHSVPRWTPIHIDNPSFEEPRLANAESWRNQATGWTASRADNHGVSQFGREFSQRTPHGSQMAFLNEGTLSQQLSETLQPNTSYRLSVWVGNRPGANSPNYSVELWAGEQKFVESQNEIIPDKGRFTRVSLTFETASDQTEMLGEPLKIVLRSNGSLATSTQNHFDIIELWKLQQHEGGSDVDSM